MKTTPMIQPASVITQAFSEEHVKIMELRECCKASVTKLKELRDKIQSLKINKHESEKLKNEYGMRNTINTNNYKSLFRAKNELHKYKCELKSEYVGIEKQSKLLKLKYNKIISSYEDEWQKTLDQYNSSSVVMELFNIQQENSRSEQEIDALLKLTNHTRTEFAELEKNIKQKFLKKIIEFAEQMMRYKSFIHCSAAEKEKTKATDKEGKTKENAENSLNTKKSIFALPKHPFESHNKGEIAFLSSIDMSQFDDLCIPKETLESQNEEEMFSVICDITNKEEEISKEKRLSKVEYSSQIKKPKYEHGFPFDEKKEKCISSKSVVNNENESQYFITAKQQRQEGLTPGELKSTVWSHEQASFKIGKNEYNKNKKDINLNIKCKAGTDEGNEFLRATSEMKFKERNNDSSNNGNFSTRNIFTEENRIESRPINISDNEENFEIRYRPASSASSGEVSIAMTADNKENSVSPALEQTNQNHFILKSEPEKNGFDLFKGFFSTGNESHSPTPSIFKLF